MGRRGVALAVVAAVGLGACGGGGGTLEPTHELAEAEDLHASVLFDVEPFADETPETLSRTLTTVGVEVAVDEADPVAAAAKAIITGRDRGVVWTIVHCRVLPGRTAVKGWEQLDAGPAQVTLVLTHPGTLAVEVETPTDEVEDLSDGPVTPLWSDCPAAEREALAAALDLPPDDEPEKRSA